MGKPVHFSKGLAREGSVTHCGERYYLVKDRYVPRVSTFPTEVTCIRCLQLAYVDMEKAYMAAKYYDADGNHKEVEHGSSET